MKNKIEMKVPLVNMNGDEMTRLIWALIIKHLLEPHISLKLENHDLGLENRNLTDDQVTRDAAEAIKRLGVGVKCATITPNDARMKEFPWLKKKFASPNGTIRGILSPDGGAIFRAPIVVPGVYQTFVRTWKKPIIIARHPFGDVYSGTEIAVPDGGGKVELVFSGPAGSGSKTIHMFDGPGIVMAQFNLDLSIRGYAKLCVAEAINRGIDLWFATKDTISKVYDARFRDIFAEEVAARKGEMEARGLKYYYMLIDDAVAQLLRAEGNFVLALKNYDGDVISDLVAQGFGSLGMMTSYLDTPNGVEYEAAHGTVQRHWYAHQAGKRTSTNSVASIFAWTGALRKRGELDNSAELCGFAQALESSVTATIKGGQMTGDLCLLAGIPKEQGLSTEEFITAIASKLAASWN